MAADFYPLFQILQHSNKLKDLNLKLKMVCVAILTIICRSPHWVPQRAIKVAHETGTFHHRQHLSLPEDEIALAEPLGHACPEGGSTRGVLGGGWSGHAVGGWQGRFLEIDLGWRNFR
jgi:hypothetical protein